MDRMVLEIREPGRQPRRITITQTVEMGRECSGVIVADATASRRHVALTASPAGITVTDLGSTNGTLVNGARINAPVLVGPGDVIRFGGTELAVVERVAAPPPTAKAPPQRPTVALDEVIDDDPAVIAARDPRGNVSFLALQMPSAAEMSAGAQGTAAEQVLAEDTALADEQLQRYGAREVAAHRGPPRLWTLPSPAYALHCAVAVERLVVTHHHNRGGAWPVPRIGLHHGAAASPDRASGTLPTAAWLVGLAASGEIVASGEFQAAAAAVPAVGFETPRAGGAGDPLVHPVRWR